MLHLPEALGKWPDREIVAYNRVSQRARAGAGMRKLRDKTGPLLAAIRAQAPGRLREAVYGVEQGYLSADRPALDRALHYARKRGALLVTPDDSRLLRAEGYREDATLKPTAAEWAAIHKRAGVPLVTLEPPGLPEAQLHSRRIRRGRPGRPGTADELAAHVFEALGAYFPGQWRGRCWEGNIDEVAAAHGVSRRTIMRLANRPSPAGPTWKELAFDKAVARGLLVPDGRGGFIITTPG